MPYLNTGQSVPNRGNNNIIIYNIIVPSKVKLDTPVKLILGGHIMHTNLSCIYYRVYI